MRPRHFLTALSFLTRLGPSRLIPEQDFAPSLPWFPLTGLVVGALAVLPAWLGLFSLHPSLAGWLIVGLSLLLTRGLHADGVSDIADAWGSSKQGDRFWEILKDSRVGAFGVLGLVMILGGQVLAFGILTGLERYGAVAWCFVLGRCVSVAALCLCRGLVRPGLSSLFASGAGTATLGLVLAQTAALGFLLAGIMSTIFGFAASGLVLAFLVRLARRQGGFNGDFMGAAIVLGELAGALGAVL